MVFLEFKQELGFGARPGAEVFWVANLDQQFFLSSSFLLLTAYPTLFFGDGLFGLARYIAADRSPYCRPVASLGGIFVSHVVHPLCPSL